MTGSPDMTPWQGARHCSHCLAIFQVPTWNLNSDLEDEILVKAFKHTRKRIRPKVSESLTFICLIRFTTIFIIVVVRFKGVGNAPIMKTCRRL